MLGEPSKDRARAEVRTAVAPRDELSHARPVDQGGELVQDREGAPRALVDALAHKSEPLALGVHRVTAAPDPDRQSRKAQSRTSPPVFA